MTKGCGETAITAVSKTAFHGSNPCVPALIGLGKIKKRCGEDYLSFSTSLWSVRFLQNLQYFFNTNFSRVLILFRCVR